MELVEILQIKGGERGGNHKARMLVLNEGPSTILGYICNKSLRKSTKDASIFVT
jgi:hypothetical protein